MRKIRIVKFHTGPSSSLLAFTTLAPLLRVGRQFGSQTRGLFEWPRTTDEDIYESPCTLRPVGARRHIGDTAKRPKKIEWIEVCPYVPGPNCTLHHRVNRPGALSPRR